MRKLLTEHENQVDTAIYDYFVAPLTPTLRKLGFTPNIITIISIMLAFLGIFALMKKETTMFTILFFTAYILDCIDGYMARKYKMESKIGDLLDHVGDLMKVAVLLYVLVERFDLLGHKGLIALIAVLALLHQFHIGCQERNSKYETHITLKITKDDVYK